MTFEEADMWQAGEHLNTVVLCDRSCRTGNLTETPRNNLTPFTPHHGRISCSCVIPDKSLTCSWRPPRSQGFTAFAEICSHASLSYCSEAQGYTACGRPMYHGHCGQEEVCLPIMALCVFVYHASQFILHQAKEPTSRLTLLAVGSARFHVSLVKFLCLFFLMSCIFLGAQCLKQHQGFTTVQGRRLISHVFSNYILTQKCIKLMIILN